MTSYAASLGALIIILSIAFDAFVQQVLTVETKTEETKLSGENLTVENILPHALAPYYHGRSTLGHPVEC